MWIGNSYTYVNDVPKTVQKLRIANGQAHEINYEEHLEGGWTWEMHANSEVCYSDLDIHTVFSFQQKKSKSKRMTAAYKSFIHQHCLQ